MSLKQETINESEMAKNYVMNSDLDDDYKTTLVDLINTSLIATNGISPEEKIQKMTNSIQKLAVSQIGLIKSIKKTLEDQIQLMYTKIDEKIVHALKEARKTQCDGCKALEHANTVEKEQERKRIIDDFIRTSGLKVKDGQLESGSNNDVDNEDDDDEIKITRSGFINRIFKILEKPYIWAFGAVVVFSPYGIEILKLIFQYFGGK